MAKYEVCPGQCLRHSGVEYPAGAIAPPLPNSSELEAIGVIREVAGPPPARPKPVVRKRAPAKKKAAEKKAD
jgi:hypothetical protein